MTFQIPIWIPNVLFLLSCVLSGYQYTRLHRTNPVTTIQFSNTIFCVIMVVVVTLYARSYHDPRVSQAFFVIAVITFYLTFRRYRTLPPK
jgi:hypothetical protein